MTAPDCPFPDRCPVPDPPEESPFEQVELPAATWSSVGSISHTTVMNASGRGDSRFSPLADADGVVPTLYLARNAVTSLLETVLHELSPLGAGRVAESELHGRVLRRLDVAAVPVVDLRDQALGVAAIARDQLVATSAAHHSCTRAWATALRALHPDAAGLLWHSRVAEVAPVRPMTVFGELLPGESSEIAVLFGDRCAAPRIAESTPLDTDDGLGLVTEIVVDLGGVLDG